MRHENAGFAVLHHFRYFSRTFWIRFTCLLFHSIYSFNRKRDKTFPVWFNKKKIFYHNWNEAWLWWDATIGTRLFNVLCL